MRLPTIPDTRTHGGVAQDFFQKIWPYPVVWNFGRKEKDLGWNGKERRGVKAMLHAGDELVRFKKDIRLIDVAVLLGYRLDTQNSSRGCSILRREQDKLAMGQQGGFWAYRNLHDETDRGSVIDFLQRRGISSLGQIRQFLRRFAQCPNPNFFPVPVQKKFNPDRKRVSAVWNAAQWQPNHPYLVSRGLDKALQADCFRDTYRADKKGNVVFPLFDDQGLCGYEYRNQGLRQMGRDSVRGLWRSRNLKEANSIIICESPIDCFSHYELYEWQAAYLSTGGTISRLQRNLFAKLFAKTHLRVVVATDNDDAGHSYYNELKKLSPALERLVPVGKDWNDDLRFCIQEKL